VLKSLVKNTSIIAFLLLCMIGFGLVARGADEPEGASGPGDLAELKQAGQLAEIDPPQQIAVSGGQATLRVQLPRQAVALFVVTWR
jgi:hypothetical protein